MLTLLALFFPRRKNFAALELGSTFRQVGPAWWITLSRDITKERRPDERRVQTG